MTKRYFAITIETAGDLDVHGIADALDHEFDLKSTDNITITETDGTGDPFPLLDQYSRRNTVKSFRNAAPHLNS